MARTESHVYVVGFAVYPNRRAERHFENMYPDLLPWMNQHSENGATTVGYYKYDPRTGRRW